MKFDRITVVHIAMLKISKLSLCLLAGVLLTGLNIVFAAKNLDAADPNKVDADFKFQGEYAGSLNGQYDVGGQVIALGLSLIHI